MAEIVFAESAWDDLNAITEYIASDSPRYAQEFYDRLVNRVEQLTDFPKSGKVVAEFNQNETRELVQGNYRIIYRIYNTSQIVILRIIHGSKLLM